MAAPQVPIDVDPETGIWTTDGLPMLYVPRHYFINQHLAMESALGRERYAAQLWNSGYKSAYTWCEKEAETHGLAGMAVFHHYLRRLSQRGWARFDGSAVDAESGLGTVEIAHSCFVEQSGGDAGGKLCYSYAGWFPGALAWVGDTLGRRLDLHCVEERCAAEGHETCLFRLSPKT